MVYSLSSIYIQQQSTGAREPAQDGSWGYGSSVTPRYRLASRVTRGRTDEVNWDAWSSRNTI
jgi:hypothetical protein